MITMTLEELKSKPIREQVEYIFDKLDSDDDDIQSLKEIIKDNKYEFILKEIKTCNRIPKNEVFTTCDDWRESRINEIVEILNKKS
jgi:hypothetical protein